MDDLRKHLNESLEELDFAEAWAESEMTYQITTQIIALRLEQGLAEKELAERVGTSQSAIACIERVANKISVLKC